MTTGRDKQEGLRKPLDALGAGQSYGVPASGEGRWQFLRTDGQSRLPSLADIFFATVEMTRMPMVVTDPRQPDNPIAFGNGAFLDLTLGKEARRPGTRAARGRMAVR